MTNEELTYVVADRYERNRRHNGPWLRTGRLICVAADHYMRHSHRNGPWLRTSRGRDRNTLQHRFIPRYAFALRVHAEQLSQPQTRQQPKPLGVVIEIRLIAQGQYLMQVA